MYVYKSNLTLTCRHIQHESGTTDEHLAPAYLTHKYDSPLTQVGTRTLSYVSTDTFVCFHALYLVAGYRFTLEGNAR